MFVADAVHNSRDGIALRSNARTRVFAWAYVSGLLTVDYLGQIN